MNYEKIGLFIKTLREKNNLSQNDLALKLNISRQAISKWERGITIPDASTLVILSDLFNVSINEILAGTYNPSDTDKITLEVLEEKQKLKSIIKKFIIAFISLLLIFLVYYFCNSYDSFKVYMLNGKYENKDLFDGMMVQADKKLYLKILKLDDNVEINSLKLYYFKNNKKIVLYENNEEVSLVNFYGINTIINKKDMKPLVNSLYLEFNDKKIKLNLDHKYSNIIKIDGDNTSLTTNPDKFDLSDEKVIKTLDNKYPAVVYGYLYESNKYKIIYNKNLKVITLKEDNEEYIYDLNNSSLYYKDGVLSFIKFKEECFGDCSNVDTISERYWEVLYETIFK